jgi:Arc/MetJ family transcription regulator
MCEVVMTVTQIDLDDETLAAAMRLMGATTKKETVNRALREYVQRVERIKAAEALAERGARGEFDEAAEAHAATRRARRAAAG